MPVTMSGMASGMNTDAIIEKLVNVEARPIRQLEERKKVYSRRKDALSMLKKNLSEVNSSARDLYGFRASYDDKGVTSSDTSIIDARANKKADTGIKKIQVLQLASTHKIATDTIEDTKKLPAGQFRVEVNGTAHVIKFKGGTLKKLEESIRSRASDIIATSIVRTSGSKNVLTLESLVSGSKGEINISGGKDFLNSIGLAGDYRDRKKSEIAITFDKRYFTSYTGEKIPAKQDGSLEVSQDGKAVTVSGLLWQEYTLPVEHEIKKDTFIEFDFTHTEKPVEEDRLPFRIEAGPVEEINIKGIELKGYNVSRIRPLKKKKEKPVFDSILGIGVISVENGKKIEKIYPVDRESKGKQEIPVGRDFEKRKISKIIYYCNSGTAVFSNARIATPIKDRGVLEPKNVIAKAENAKLKIDGIEIERDRNDELGDVVKGLTLQLKKASDRVVQLKVDLDIDKPVEKIKKFVDAYNAYIELHRKLVKTAKAQKPGDYRKSGYSKGLFVGDMTIIRLENTMKRTVNGAYPSTVKTPIRVLSQIGVSTGAINASWESIKEGKLIVDDTLLRKTLLENPDGVREFFGSDNDGDARTDNGMAFSLVNVLKPYVSSGNNVIVSKINLEEDSIKRADERIERHREHLKKFEDRLRSKFATMEKAISGANAQKNWMNNQLGNTKKDK